MNIKACTSWVPWPLLFFWGWPWPFYRTSFAKNLGVSFDGNFTSEKPITSVVNDSFQLRLFAIIKNVLSSADFENIISAFISSRRDFWNRLYFGISQALLLSFPTCSKCSFFILYFAFGYFRIDFKILLDIFQSLNWLAPSYLTELCIAQMDHQGQLFRCVWLFQ